MATSVTPETTPGGYQPQPASLEAAQQRFLGLLSRDEDTQPEKTPPEQPAKTGASAPAATPTEQAPVASPETGSEQAESTEQQASEATPVTTTYKAKINGQEVEVTLEEALKGYSRTEDYTRKTQQLAEKNKLLAEKEAVVEAERQRYATNLAQLEQAIKTVTPDEPNWDVRRLQVTPDVLAQEMLNWRENAKRLDAIRNEQTRIAEMQRTSAQEAMQRHLAKEQELLNAALPDIADPTTGPTVRSSLYSYAKNLGFDDDQISSATTSHQVVVLLHKAMQWDKAQANKPKVENKIQAALATPAPQNRSPAPAKSKLAEAKSRLKDSGRVEDAAAAFYQLLD